MPTKKLWPKLPLILLLGFTLAFESCETVTVKNRVACFINGEISLGSTCANTVTNTDTTQLTPEQTVQFLEAGSAHAPAVFQSATDYGEETTELESACRILGKNCSYELQATIATHKKVLEAIHATQSK